ncbi:MAG: Hsp33 family molecular chaperone HslO [Alphaproteobacteria bacterium]
MTTEPTDAAAAGDNLIQPFRIEPVDSDKALQGRLIRLGDTAHEILTRHDYPKPVATLLGECLALTVTLASALKFDGIFILQIQCDGPVSLIVVDISSTGDLRGYAKFDSALVQEWQADNDGAPVRGLLGQGRLAFTVDQGDHTERYQGIVALTGATLTQCAQHYFRQSVQLDAGLVLVARQVADGNGLAWRAGGLLVQRLAESAEVTNLSSDDGDDPWRRAMMLMATGTETELLDPALSAQDYLYRLFHQEGLRVSSHRPLRARCHCSSERITTVLESLPGAELIELAVDGKLEVTCEFCSRVYELSPSDVT